MRTACALLIATSLTAGCSQREPATEPDSNSPFSSAAARLEHEKLQARLRELQQPKPAREAKRPPEVTTAAVTNPVSPEKEAQLRQTIAQHEQSLAACEIQLRAVRAAAPAHADKVLSAIGDVRASLKRIEAQLDRHEDAPVVQREVANLMQQFGRLQATAQQGLR